MKKSELECTRHLRNVMYANFTVVWRTNGQVEYDYTGYQKKADERTRSSTPNIV